MFLFLTSSPCVIGADRAILNEANGFVDRLREVLPEYPKCLFICSDPNSHGFTDGFAREMAEAFEEAGLPLKGYATLDGRNWPYAEPLIWASDLIVLAGGHVPTQNDFLMDVGLDQMLQHFQGVVMGISAGSMNCADTVYVQPEEPGESARSFQRFTQGLGLTDINILPHYQQVKDNILDGKRLFEDITYEDSMDHTFLALVDGSYVFSDGDGNLLCGEAYLLEDGHMEQICSEGEEIVL